MDEKWIDLAIEFTDCYRRHLKDDKAIREIACDTVLFPAMLKPLKEDDIFAGRDGHLTMNDWPVMFHPRRLSQFGYNMNVDTLNRLKEDYPNRRADIDGLIDYWKTETTFVKIREEASPELQDYLYFGGRGGVDDLGYMRRGKRGQPLGSGFISGSNDTRATGTTPNYETILKLGIPGLYEKVEQNAKQHPESAPFYTACRMALDITVNCLNAYAEQAQSLLRKTEVPVYRSNLTRIYNTLQKLKTHVPETLYEGIQLMNLFRILTRTDCYGRMDVYFADLLENDIANGVDIEEETALVQELWKIIDEVETSFDTRVYIGGMARKNEKYADMFALIAIEATRRNHLTKPVLSLRLYRGQNEELLRAAVNSISEGCIYPTLYNDERYVPGVMEMMHVPYDDAVHYAPLGCGETILETRSTGSPNSTMRFLKALEAVLHDGCDGVDGKQIGTKTGKLSEFHTYEDLEKALFTQIRDAFAKDIHIHAWNKRISGREASNVFNSLVMDDCLERGKDFFDGGLRYFGANIEGFGVTNTANSLAVIKKLVYDEKKYTLEELVDILDRNYEGCEDIRKEFENVPKYGNNDSYVDDIKTRLERFINETADGIGRANGFPWYTVASVNPGGIELGPNVAASADGRKCGEPMAVGDSAMPGTDRKGLTALLLSAAKSDNRHGGMVTNVTMSRETITADKEKFRKLLESFFSFGGQQLNLNCFSRGDLEAALKNPEKYSNLIVRVSGYSARFIDLDPITQKHIMDRTLY